MQVPSLTGTEISQEKASGAEAAVCALALAATAGVGEPCPVIIIHAEAQNELALAPWGKK